MLARLSDPTFWVYLTVAMVWLYRGRRALEALHVIPCVFIPSRENTGDDSETISIILPVKNEEKNIRACLENLLNQDYKKIQIIVANNDSADETEHILQGMGIPNLESESPRAKKTGTIDIGYCNTNATPAGWTGKNFAIHRALGHAKGQWLLFTDADTRHEPSSVRSALHHAKSRDLKFLTLLPRCMTRSFFESLIQPLAEAFLGLWFPMEKVNRSDTEAFFGNGQYILMERAAYESVGGHECVKNEFLEDYALTRLVKKGKIRFEIALGTLIFGTRMYDSLNTTWQGWRRIYLFAFERKPWILLSKFLSVLCFSVLPFFCFIPLTQYAVETPEVYGFSWGIAAVILSFIIFTTWKAYGVVHAKKSFAVLHPLGAIFIAMILLDAFGMALSRKEPRWR